MHQLIQLRTIIPYTISLFNRSPWPGGFLLIALACVAISPTAQAVLPAPAPDGGYLHYNTAEGDGALFSLDGGFSNTAIGYQALYKNTSGSANTAVGLSALHDNATGDFNTANGWTALLHNNIGSDNTAIGYSALMDNTAGNFNTAMGDSALLFNITGSYNTAIGYSALESNTTGASNVASGDRALLNNTSGSYNTAMGSAALYSNTTGNNNLANGASALYNNTTGYYNMANGSFAMVHNTTGKYNVAEGLNALFHNTTGSNNIAIGLAAGGNLTTGNGNIDIGNNGLAAESNTIRVGTSQSKAFVAGVRNAVVAGGVAVYVNASGQLGTNPSSQRFKEGITAMDKKSASILALHPVTFRYKQELDPNNVLQFGLIAEDVAKVNPDLVARDDKGEIYSVRYEAVNAMLLNEFLKQYRKVEEQEATMTQLKSTVAKQEATITQQQKNFQSALEQQQKETKVLATRLNEQALQIQKVSQQLAVSQTAPQLVVNNR